MLKINKKIRLCAVLIAMFCSTSAFSQFNGGNVSSPYSMFGVGDIRSKGSAQFRSMGGGGYAAQSPFFSNMLNPASNGVIQPQSFYFAAGMEGVNNYLSTDDASTSMNGANFSYLTLRFPITKGLGFGLSMTPYSSSGYSIRALDERDDVVTNIGSMSYLYDGKGDIAEYKLGFGWNPFKNFYVGANLIYYLGTLQRNLNVSTIPYIDNVNYAVIDKSEHITFNKPSMELGFQYSIKLKQSSFLTLGLVYQPSFNSNVDINYLTTSSKSGSAISDTVRNVTISEPFSFPQKIAGGINFTNTKFNISADYVFEEFSKSFGSLMTLDNVKYNNRHSAILGLEYTPDRFNVRSYMKRISYRVGTRYVRDYLNYNDNSIDEFAVSVGVGIPLNSSMFSGINIGAEYAIRGSTQDAMIQTQVFSFFMDVQLFTNKQWFVRFKNH